MTDPSHFIVHRNRKVFEDALRRQELCFDYHKTVKVQNGWEADTPSCVYGVLLLLVKGHHKINVLVKVITLIIIYYCSLAF